MDTQAKQHLLSTLCELGFCIGLDKSLFWLGHHNSACYTNIASVTQKFNTLTFL